jgi:hypothetical protein
MPEAKAKPASGTERRHWASISDDRLIDLELEIDNPENLEGLVREVPANFAEAHVEFKYDLRGQDVTEFTCVHGHHQHKAGFVMNVEGIRFMVGWMCAEQIYNENFEQYTADFETAIGRRDALLRVREIRVAMSQFSSWLDRVSTSGAVDAFMATVDRLERTLPFVCETLRRGRPVGDVHLPRSLYSPAIDLQFELVQLMSATAAINMKASEDALAVAASIGSIRADILHLVRRAEVMVSKLFDLELLFQPIVLQAICEAAENAIPRRKRHFADLMKIGTRDGSVEMPTSYVVPNREPLDALHAAVAGAIADVVKPPGERTVSVLGQSIVVTTHKKGRSSWVATGNYNGNHHSAESRTEGSAVEDWQTWALYRAR